MGQGDVGRLGGTEPEAEAIQVDVDDWRGVEGEDLAEDQAADNGNAEGAAEFGTDACPEGQGQSAEERGHGGHDDGAEAEAARFDDGLIGGETAPPFGVERKVDHENGVFLDDADEQQDADQGDNTEWDVEHHQREKRAYAGGRER